MKRLSYFLIVFIMIFGLIGCSDPGQKEPSDPTKAVVPSSNYSFEGYDYNDVKEKLEKAGFTNIKFEIIYDLTTGWLVSDGEVETVSIDGKTSFSAGDEFSKNVEIIITYHTFKSNKPDDPDNPDNPVTPPVSTKIKLPSKSSSYDGKLYTEVQEDLEDAGFTNIKFGIIYDLITGWLVSDGEIESVSIGGNTSFNKGDEYEKDVEIIITYHTFESNKPKDSVTPSEDFSKDTYDDSYTGQKYRVNVIVEFNPNIFLDIYDVNLRIDGRVFETLEHGVNGDYEYDLKPGKHTIAFTKIDDTSVYGYGTIDVKSDMSVNYYIKGHEENIDCEERSINLNAYYTITLDSNGGEPMESIKVKVGQKLTNPGRPDEMEEYQFKGWSEDGINPIEYPYYVNSNVTLKALWEEKPDLVFEQCWKKSFSNYSFYILIDEDTNTVVWTMTNDTYVAQGKIISGNLSSGMSIEYNRKGQTWTATLKYSNSMALAAYTDNTGNTISNTYTLEVDSEEAEKYLDDLNYDYKNFN